MTYLPADLSYDMPQDIAAPAISAAMPRPRSGLRGIAQRRLLVILWMWVCRLGRIAERTGRRKDTRAIFMARVMIILILKIMPGSPQEKSAILKRMLVAFETKREALYAKLRAAYIIWRQRKCWMWGGGFKAASLTALPDVFLGAEDQMSFDGLIPN